MLINRYRKIKNEWIRTLLFYLLFYMVVIIPLYLFFYSYKLFYIDINSALYMLNTLIESLASVLAIVVTLSLVAAQLASTASTRILVIFRKSPDLWILISIYIIAIIYALSVLTILDPQRIPELQWHLSFIYFISIFAFAALIPYIWDILLLMNPEKVIKKLGEDINKESILMAVEAESEDAEYTTGPIQPLIDMMNGAQLKFQVGTFRIGLETMEKGILNILQNPITEKEEIEISNYLFVNHMDRVAKVSLRNRNEISSSAFTKSLYRISKHAICRDQKAVFGYSISLLGEIGQKSAQQAMKYPASNCIVYLGQLGMIALRRELKYRRYLTALVLYNIISIYEEALKNDDQYLNFIRGFMQGLNQQNYQLIRESGDDVLVKIYNEFLSKIEELNRSK